LAQPICGRCAKLKLKCINSGVGRFKFVVQDDPGKKKSTPPPTQSHSPASDWWSDVSQSPSSRCTSAELVLADHTVATNLERTALLAQAVGDFWYAYAPKVGYGVVQEKDITSVRWLQAAFVEATTDKTLHDAMMGLALARAGRITDDGDTKRAALGYYGACIASLRHSIDIGQRTNDDALLATTMLLATFEVYEGNENRDSAWSAHISAASRIIRLRGRSILATPFGRELYLKHMRDELLYSMGDHNLLRRSTRFQYYLDDLEMGGRPDVRLAEILDELPASLELADSIRSLEDPDEVQIRTLDLMGRFSKISIALLELESDMRQAQPSAISWEEPSLLYNQLPEDSPGRLFKTHVHFSDILTGTVLLTNWTSRLLIGTTTFFTYKWIQTKCPAASAVIVPLKAEDFQEATTLAFDITKSLEYFLLPDAGLSAVQQIDYPISLVLGFFKFWNLPQEAWLAVVFQRMRELKVGVDGFLEDSWKGDVMRLVRPLKPNSHPLINASIKI
jgi:hypothetical protein